MEKNKLGIPEQLGELRLVENLFELGWLPVVAHNGRPSGYVPRGFESCVRVLDAIYSDRLGRDLRWSDLDRTIAAHGLQGGLSVRLSGKEDLDGTRGEFVPERVRYRTLEVIETQIASCFPGPTRCLYALSNLNPLFNPLFNVSVLYSISDIRSCYVYEGGLGNWRSIWPEILPSLWWPTDRKWCVARDIDINWSYIAGATALTDRLLATDLPCAPVDWDERM